MDVVRGGRSVFDRGIGCEKKSDSIVGVGLDRVGYSGGYVDKSVGIRGVSICVHSVKDYELS